MQVIQFDRFVVAFGASGTRTNVDVSTKALIPSPWSRRAFFGAHPFFNPIPEGELARELQSR
jgi:hypothetical protein